MRLFVSDRVFIDGSFHNGGIVVNDYGQIEEVFKDQAEVNKWLLSASQVEVIDTFKVSTSAHIKRNLK